MTDDSWPIKEKMDFHPTDPPKGMEYYNLDELSEDQRKNLNDLKINAARSNEKYLASHPEIRAIVVILMKYLLRYRPKIKVHEFIARFFNRSEESIQHDIDEYLETRKDHVSENLSAVNLALRRKQPSHKDEVLDRLLEMLCSEKCKCIPESNYKLDPFQRFDDFSFVETEHWLTPKSSIEKVASTVESIPSAVRKLMKFIGRGDEEDEEEEDETHDSIDANVYDFFFTQPQEQTQKEVYKSAEDIGVIEETQDIKEEPVKEEEPKKAISKPKVVQIMEDPEKIREKIAKKRAGTSAEEVKSEEKVEVMEKTPETEEGGEGLKTEETGVGDVTKREGSVLSNENINEGGQGLEGN